MGLDAGRLIHQVVLVRTTGSKNIGQIIHTEVPVDTYWALVEPLQGREAVNAKQIKESISLKVTMRYNTEIRAKDKLTFNGRKLEIVSVVNENERDEWLICLVEETK